MTDEEMDARLRRAGEAWRLASAPTAAIDSVEPQTLVHDLAERPHRHRTALLASAAAVVAALVAGTSILVANLGGGHHRTAATENGVPLAGTVWRFVGYGDQTMPSSLASLYIGTDGQFVADDTCDLIGGRMNVDQGHLYPTQLQQRYYNCVDSVGEVVFDMDVFTSGPSYTLDPAGALTITGGGKTMHLLAAPGLPVPTADRPTVTGASWKLTKVTGPDGNELPVTGDASFKVDNGRLQASDTCNTLSGDAVVTGQHLDTKNIASTAVGCTGDVAATAAVIDNVLTGSALVAQRFTQLTIGQLGVGALTYEWVPEDAAATDPAALTGKQWFLTSLAGDPVSATDGVTLKIDADGTTAGYDGCRKFDARATIGSGTLDFGTTLPSYQPGPAEPGCNDPDLATSVESLLSQHPALWHVQNGDLVINGYGAQAFAMVFKSQSSSPPPNQPSQLAGTAWTLTTIESGSGPNGTASSVVTDVTVRFLDEGHLTVSHRCYVDKGDVQIDSDMLTISNKTLENAIPCPAKPQLEQEEQQENQVVDNVLSGTSQWAMTDKQLRISKDGVGALVFIPAAGPVSLIGTPWTLESMSTEGTNSGGGSASSNSGIVLTLGKGQYQLATGCHSYQGTADVSGPTITFGNQQDLGGDSCLNTMAQDLVVMLDGTVAWSVGDGRLTLTKGNTTATFTGSA